MASTYKSGRDSLSSLNSVQLAMDTHLKVASSAMSEKGGLIVIGETVATLHKEIPESKIWDTIGYGIPCLNLNDDVLIISLSCLRNGETLHEFSITGPDRYKVLDSHFHVFSTERSRITVQGHDTGRINNQPQHNLTTNSYSHHAELTYGLSFAHEKVAERFFKAVIQLIPKKITATNTAPGYQYSLRDRLSQSLSLSTSLTITPEEMTDFPPLIQSDSFVAGAGGEQNFPPQIEEAGALTSSGKFIPNPVEEHSGEDEQSLRVLRQSYSNGNIRAVGEDIIEDVDISEKHKTDKSNPRLNSNPQNGTGMRRSNSFFFSSGLLRRRGSLDNSSEALLSGNKHSLIKQRSESMEDVRISYPTTVRHLAHVTQETPFYTLKQVINTGCAPYSVLESDIEKQRYEKLKRTPSAPHGYRARHKSSSFVNSTPSILVSPPEFLTLSKKHLPKPPPQVVDFDALVKKLQTTGDIDRHSELTSSTQAWQHSFYGAVSNLIRKKIFDDSSNSKLLSFTQSGREETTERPDSRATSLIIHDHGVVCL